MYVCACVRMSSVHRTVLCCCCCCVSYRVGVEEAMMVLLRRSYHLNPPTHSSLRFTPSPPLPSSLFSTSNLSISYPPLLHTATVIIPYCGCTRIVYTDTRAHTFCLTHTRTHTLTQVHLLVVSWTLYLMIIFCKF